MTLNGFQIHATLLGAGIPLRDAFNRTVIWEPSDRVYILPQSSWVLGDFSRWWRTQAAPALGMDVYTDESGDCDDAVDTHNALAKWAHRRMQEAKGLALPIGRLNYLQNPVGPDFKKHACAWCITVDRGLIFPEPQILYGEQKPTVPQLNSTTRCTD